MYAALPPIMTTLAKFDRNAKGTEMSEPITRRSFGAVAAGLAVATEAAAADPAKPNDTPAVGPVEAPFERDYAAPAFKPSWKKQQLNRTLVQDFVIYAHSDLAMTKTLLEKQPALVNAVVDWGAGDWESGLGGASHMGRRDIVEYLLAHGARIDAKGPHGVTLHFHAQVGGKEAEPVLEYLQSVKKLDLKPVPFKTGEPRPKS